MFYSVCMFECSRVVLLIWCLSSHSMIQMISALTSMDQSEFRWHESAHSRTHTHIHTNIHTHTLSAISLSTPLFFSLTQTGAGVEAIYGNSILS